jgi:hypothetical protein
VISTVDEIAERLCRSFGGSIQDLGDVDELDGAPMRSAQPRWCIRQELPADTMYSAGGSLA